VPGSLATLPLRLSLRTARAALRTTRDAAELGLAALDLVGRAIGGGSDPDAEAPAGDLGDPIAAPAVADDLDDGVGFPDEPLLDGDDAPPPVARPVVVPDPPPEPEEAPEPLRPELEHIEAEVELVEELAEPGAEDGAGAEIHIEPPFDGYDRLKAGDVVARLATADAAEIAAIVLYETMHRRRSTILAAADREQRRRGPR
jgi:hypothetical protein